MNTMKQWLAVLATAFAITATSVSTQAAKPQSSPSPFAGVWCGYDWFPITISDSGRVTGKSDDGFNASLSGRITNDGVMDLKLTYTLSGCWDECSKRGGTKTRVTFEVTGLAAIDETGNLVGVWFWNGEGPYDFTWTRCQ